MVKFNMSQFKSKIRQVQSKQRQAVSRFNQAINTYNRDVKKSINAYNRAVRNYNTMVRNYNSAVRKNRQIIQREVVKLNAYNKTHVVASVRTMQTYYNRIVNAYPEGAHVSPEENRILDLIENENANSIITANLVENNVLPTETTEDVIIGDKLKLVSEDLNNRWQGALFALHPNNPDATRHFCTSTREIFVNFIEIKAPDAEVFNYNPNCKTTPNGNPTRKEKIKYMMRNKMHDDNIVCFADANIDNILELNYILSGGTHGEAGKYTFETLMQVKKCVESGINFLCEISA